MKKEATITLKLITGILPNFIKVDNGRERQTYVDAGELTDKEVDAYIRQWSKDFRDHAAKRRQVKLWIKHS